jgi:hypothetical protein
MLQRCYNSKKKQVHWLLQAQNANDKQEDKMFTKCAFWTPLSKCCNPTLRECEDETHTLEMGTWESSGIPKSSEFD